MSNKQQASQRAFDLLRCNLNDNEKRQNAIHRKNSSSSKQEKRKKKFFFTFELFLLEPLSRCRFHGRAITPLKNDLPIQLSTSEKKISTKQEMEYYRLLKHSTEPPSTSNVPTRNKLTGSLSKQHDADTDSTLNHDNCLSFLPFFMNAFPS